MAAITTSTSKDTAGIWLPEIIMAVCKQLTCSRDDGDDGDDNDSTEDDDYSTQRSLASLALVNKTARPIAQTALYNHINLNKIKQPFKLFRTLIERSNLAAKVRCISIELENNHRMVPQLLGSTHTDTSNSSLSQVSQALIELKISEGLQNRLLMGLRTGEQCSFFATLICLCSDTATIDVVAIEHCLVRSYKTLLEVIRQRGDKLQRLTHVRFSDCGEQRLLHNLAERLFSLPSLRTLNFSSGEYLSQDSMIMMGKNIRRLGISVHFKPGAWKIFASLPNLIVLDIVWQVNKRSNCDWDEVAVHLPRQLQKLSIKTSYFPEWPDSDDTDATDDTVDWGFINRGRLALDGLSQLRYLGLPLEALVNPEAATGHAITMNPWKTTSNLGTDLLQKLPSLTDMLPEIVEIVRLQISDTPGQAAAYLDMSVSQLTSTKKQPLLHTIRMNYHRPIVPNGWRLEDDEYHDMSILIRQGSQPSQRELYPWPWQHNYYE